LSQDAGSSSSAAVQQNDGYGWVHLGAGEEISILSPPAVPTNTTGAAYNVYVSYTNTSRGWLYSAPLYTAIGAKPIPTNFFGLFDYSNTDVVLLLMLVLVVFLTIALVPRLRRKRHK